MDKDVAILRATVRLIEKGTPPHFVKISDVAAEAGIGKGTVYEYFSSKDELLAKAFCFGVGEKLELLSTEFEKGTDFHHGFMSVLGILSQCSNRFFSLFRFCDPDMIALAQAYHFIDEVYHQHFDTLLGFMDRILERGCAEGIFPPPASVDYGRFALIASFSGFHSVLSAQSLKGTKDDFAEQVMELTYDSLRKSLQ